MNKESKLIEQAIKLAVPERVEIDEDLHQLVHDLQGCLQVIGLGTALLEDVRDDDAKFSKVCSQIDRERREAVRILDEFLRSTHQDE